MMYPPFEDREDRDQARKDARLFDSLDTGRYQDVVECIKSGASINSVDPSGCRPVHYAASFNSAKCLDYILQCKAMVETKDYAGWTPLHIASGGGNLECVECLLRHKAEIDIIESTGGSTALHIAASRGQDKVLLRLLQAGADISKQDKLDFTPLNQAAVNGWGETCRLLLQNGAQADHTNSQGYTPLHLAVINGNLSTVKVLVEYPSALVRRLKRAIVDIFCNQLKLVHLDVGSLITDIAVPLNNIEILDVKGRSALDIAEVRGRIEIAEYLRNLMTTHKVNQMGSSTLKEPWNQLCHLFSIT